MHPYFQNANTKPAAPVGKKNPFKIFCTKNLHSKGISVISSSVGHPSLFESGSVDLALSSFDFQVAVYSN